MQKSSGLTPGRDPFPLQDKSGDGKGKSAFQIIRSHEAMWSGNGFLLEQEPGAGKTQGKRIACMWAFPG